MHDQPEPTEEEQEQAERQHEQEEQRGPVPADPELPADEPEGPVHDA